MTHQPQIHNALITRTHLGPEDHGILTAWLYLKFDGTECEFGGYSFDRTVRRSESVVVPNRSAALFIRKTLAVVGAERWEQLPGRYCRVSIVDKMIQAIGHIVESRWFFPRDEILFMEKYYPEDCGCGEPWK